MRHSVFFLIPAILGAHQGASAPRSVNDLKVFFQANCVRCHGADGSGRDASGKRLPGEDFTNLREMAHKKDVKLALTIRRGIFFGKAMPAWKEQLSEAEAALIVKEIVRKAAKGRLIAPQSDADQPGASEKRKDPPQ